MERFEFECTDKVKSLATSMAMSLLKIADSSTTPEMVISAGLLQVAGILAQTHRETGEPLEKLLPRAYKFIEEIIVDMLEDKNTRH